MATSVVNPVEWLDAVYTITGTAKPTDGTGASGGVDDKVKKELRDRHDALLKRVTEQKKAPIPASLVGKLRTVDEDLKSNYKVSALDARLKEIEKQIAAVEQQGGVAPRTKEWHEESSRIEAEFRKSCKEVEAALVTKLQQRAQKRAADPNNNELVKKRLLAAAQETNVNLIAAPLRKMMERFDQDLDIGGDARKNEVRAQYQQELKDTKAEIDKMISGDNFTALVRREQKEREKERDNQGVSDARVAVIIKVRQLRDLDRARAKEYDDELAAANSPKEVARISRNIDGSIARRKLDPNEIEAKQKAMAVKGKAVIKAKKGTKGDQRDKIRDMQKGLIGTKALAATGNKKVAQAAEKLAAEMAAAAQNPEVAKLYAIIGTLTKDLGDRNLALFYPKEKPGLLDRLKKLSADLNPLDLEPSTTALAEIEVRVKTLTTETQARLNWQKTTEASIGQAEYWFKRLLGSTFRLMGKDRKRGLVEEGKNLRAACKAPEAVMKKVDQDVANFRKRILELENLKVKPGGKAEYDKAMNEDQAAGQKIEADRVARAKRVKTLSEARKTLEKELKAQKVKGDVVLEDRAALASELLKSAQQMLKAQDLDAAAKKHDKAEEIINELKGKKPVKAENAAKYLRTAGPASWGNVVGIINGQIDAIRDEALKIAGPNGPKVTATIKQVTDDVFSPDLFKSLKAPIEQLITDPDQNKKKAAREKILTEVRYIRKSMESNPVLMQLRLNPFGKKLASSPVAAFLNELELKTTEAIRGK